MKTSILAASLAGAGLAAAGLIAVVSTTDSAQSAPTRAADKSEINARVLTAKVGDHGDLVAAGRHLVLIAGCNDCHTPGYLIDPNVPEGEWFTGVPVGWKGPWGTTYASNLRYHIAAFTDSELWIRMIRARNGLPPMPWASLHSMTDEELRAIHAYLSSLPLAGEVMPIPVPPDKTPTTPYLNLVPVMPEHQDQDQAS